MSKIDTKKLENVSVTNIDMSDAPDFTDAFIEYAEIDGRPLTDDELDELNYDFDFIHQQVEKKLYG